MESFYVVVRGKKPGIYNNWIECKSYVDGFKNPLYKKFTTLSEAKLFFEQNINTHKQLNTQLDLSSNNNTINTINTINNTNSNLIGNDVLDKIKGLSSNIKSSEYSDDLNYNVEFWNTIDNELYIFIDGSSRIKSKDYNNSGVGIYIGYKCTNIKEQYHNKTNNQCELIAMDYAFKLIIRYFRELSEMKKVIKIVSDSEYSIKAITVWLANWKKNNWKTAKGEDVKNKDLIESIEGSMMRIKTINSNLEASKKIKVKMIHIHSHQEPNMENKTTFSIWFGNYIADKLAQNSLL